MRPANVFIVTIAVLSAAVLSAQDARRFTESMPIDGVSAIKARSPGAPRSRADARE